MAVAPSAPWPSAEGPSDKPMLSHPLPRCVAGAGAPAGERSRTPLAGRPLAQDELHDLARGVDGEGVDDLDPARDLEVGEPGAAPLDHLAGIDCPSGAGNGEGDADLAQ